MNVTRVAVQNALFNLMKAYIEANYTNFPGVPQFVTFSKSYRPYTKVTSGQQPAFFLALGPQSADQDTTPGATRWELTFYALIMLTVSPDSIGPYPTDVILSTLDMIDASLQNSGIRRQDLSSQNGGKPLVYNCWIDRRNGKIEIRQPILSQQAYIIVPITVIVGAQFMGMPT